MRRLFKIGKFADTYGTFEDRKDVTTDSCLPNIISSLISSTGERHMPVIDIDFPCYVIPSSTPGHFHLYLDKEISWQDYEFVLFSMKRAGLIDPGFYDESVRKRQTFARLPWIKKDNK